jgi:hypothetical protein
MIGNRGKWSESKSGRWRGEGGKRDRREREEREREEWS